MSKEVTITVFERNDPLVLISLRRPDNFAYDLTGVTDLEFYLKAKKGVAPEDAIAVYKQSTAEITVTDATAGLVTVQFTAAHIAEPGHYAFHLDELRGTKRLTLARGKVDVQNT